MSNIMILVVLVKKCMDVFSGNNKLNNTHSNNTFELMPSYSTPKIPPKVVTLSCSLHSRVQRLFVVRQRDHKKTHALL